MSLDFAQELVVFPKNMRCSDKIQETRLRPEPSPLLQPRLLHHRPVVCTRGVEGHALPNFVALELQYIGLHSLVRTQTTFCAAPPSLPPDNLKFS